MLQCPYSCGTALRAPGQWITFKDVCPACGYRIDREPGYFWGASWMISYTIVGVLALFLAVYLLFSRPEMDAMVIASVSTVFALIVGWVFTPFGKAIWLWADHMLHPLGPADYPSNNPV